MHSYCIENLPERWFGCGGDKDSFLMKWLLWSLELSLCYFFLLGYVKGLVCVSVFLLALMNLGRESLLYWIMLLEICYCAFGKCLTTDLTCAVSQAVYILNTYEIDPRINFWCSTPKLFNFIELDLVVFKIIAFKMMSNFLGHCVCNIYIYIYFFPPPKSSRWGSLALLDFQSRKITLNLRLRDCL